MLARSHNLVERVWDRVNLGYDNEWKTIGCFLIGPFVFRVTSAKRFRSISADFSMLLGRMV